MAWASPPSFLHAQRSSAWMASGAYEHVSRAAMFEGLRRDNRLAGLIPFVRQFYGQESSYFFYDAFGPAHDVLQAEGGEQGDPLMPGLFAVTIHQALVATQTTLPGGERLYGFLDDAYLTCDPSASAQPSWPCDRRSKATPTSI